MFVFMLLLMLFSSCNNAQSHGHGATYRQEIPCRDGHHSLIYRVKIPANWNPQILLPSPDESITDTKKPLCELSIHDPLGKIRITIHNFPSQTIEDRIPPGAQISRWKKQFESLDPNSEVVMPQSFSGYTGFFLQAQGQLMGQEIMMLGWTMSLAAEHYRRLDTEQKRADFTIKATGQPEAMQLHREEIIAFARSFELIEEIPSR